MKPKILFLTSAKSRHVVAHGDSPLLDGYFDAYRGTEIDDKYDLVYTQMYGQEVVFRQFEGYSGKYVIHVGGDIFLERQESGHLSNLGRIRKIMRNATSVVCVSKFLANVIREHIGTDNVTHLPGGMWGLDHTRYGIQLDRFEPKHNYRIENNRRPICVMNISLSVERKWRGLPLFLDSVKHVVDYYNARLVCCGKIKKHHDQVERWSDEYGIEFPGYIDDWPAMLRGADVFLHPSLWDGFPRAIADACCCGLPGVVFNSAGCPEVSDNVLLVNPDARGDIAAQIDCLLRSARYRHEVGSKMYREAVCKTNQHRGDYVDLLRELVR